MAAGIKSFNHVQASASANWIINHLLGHPPVVDVVIDFNGGRQKVMPLGVEHVTTNQTVVRFSSPQTGSARLY